MHQQQQQHQPHTQGPGVGLGVVQSGVQQSLVDVQDGDCLDLSNRSLHSTEHIANTNPRILVYNRNFLQSLDNLHRYDNLEQLSAAYNQLVDMSGVTLLHNLTVLDLSNNSITAIKCLRNLTKLTRLNLAANDIRVIEHLNLNVNLQYIDLSYNNICSLGDIRGLTKLKTLLLHGNQIGSLATAKTMLPWSITTLALASNNITDLNEVSHLSHLIKLEQLSVMDNPCVTSSQSDCLLFDYRPFIVNWCITVRVLDGSEVTAKEGLKAEWLFSQGKGRRFNPGEHQQLVHYLSSVCPLNASVELERAEDVKLNRVLQQQRLIQQQRRSGTSLDDTSHSHHHTPPSNRSGASDTPLSNRSLISDMSPSNRTAVAVEQQTVFSKVKASRDTVTVMSQDLMLEDVSSGDESTTMLDSESRYLPVLSEASSVAPSPRHVSASSTNISLTNAAVSSGPTSAPTGSHPAPSLSNVTVSRSSSAASSLKPTRRIAANFSQNVPVQRVTPPPAAMLATETVIQPTQSTSQPKPHAVVSRRHSQSPVARTLHLDNDVIDSVDSLEPNTEPPSSRVGNEPAVSRVGNEPAVSPAGNELLTTSRVSTEVVSRSIAAIEPPLGGRSAVELRLLKDASRKPTKTRRSPGRRDENGILLAASSSLYTPEKYRDTMRQIYGDDGSEHVSSRHSSASDLSAPTDRLLDSKQQTVARQHTKRWTADDVRNGNSLSDVELDKQHAAVMLQALWRGYRARQRDPDVLHVRHELRSRRTEDHIRFLKLELDRQCHLNEQEKQLRTKHVTALKHLLKEVQSLHEWRNQVMSSCSLSQDQSTGTLQAGRLSVSETCVNDSNTALGVTHQLLNELEKASGDNESIDYRSMGPLLSVASPKLPVTSHNAPNTFQFPVSSMLLCSGRSQVDSSEPTQKELQLEQMCRSLHKQMCELRELVASQLSFGVNVISASHDLTDTCVQQSCDNDSTLSQTLGTNATTFPAPTDLRVVQLTADQVDIQWKPPTVAIRSKSQLFGYRVYLNNEPEGLVNGTLTQLTVRDLLPGHQYRLCLRCVYSLGESYDSELLKFQTLFANSRESDMESNSSETDSDLDRQRQPSGSSNTGDKSTSHSIQRDTAVAAAAAAVGCTDSKQVSSSHMTSKQSVNNSGNVLHMSMASSRISEVSELSGGSRTFPTRRLSDDNNVRPVSTYPLNARKSLEQVIRTSCRSSREGRESVGGGTKAPAAALLQPSHGVAATTSGVAAVEDQQTSGEDEVKFIPKPPDESAAAFPRRNSLTRRGSMRKRNNSGSTPPAVEIRPSNETDNVAGIQRVQPLNLTGNLQVEGGKKRVMSESESSAEQVERSRSREVKCDMKPERRSSSMGAITRDTSKQTTSVAEKPPVAARREPSTERLTAGTGRKEELKVPSAGKPVSVVKQDKLPRDGALPQPIKDDSRSSVHKMKKFFGHKRSKSDLRTATDRRQSDPPPAVTTCPVEQTFSPTVPTPSSSPRLQRSSSFSVRGDGSMNSPLRQAISLETLKALSKIPPPDPTTSPAAAAAAAAAAAGRLSAGRTDSSSDTVGICSSPPRLNSSSSGAVIGTHSPRLSARRSPDTTTAAAASKQHLSNKASALFAQLQKRISTNNNKM